MTTEYLDANRANWNERATLHAARDGSGYGVLRYVEDRDALSDVVRFDQPLLGDLTGTRAVHLQCHIGTDTLSLARLGARVTGLDFSENAVEEARRLVAETGDAVDFVRSDVSHATDVLPAGEFDLVYTGIGALCWLPSISEWAGVVAELLAPGGTLHIREGHPVLWSMNETLPGLTLAFPYFEQPVPLEWDDDSTYVEVSAPLQSTRTYEWNRSLGEIVTALLDRGLRLDALIEHDSVPWEALPGRMTLRPDGEYALTEQPSVMPLSYTIRASKPV
ncbi:MAG: methyltransferase [Microbacterium sp. 71-36]|mgnify:FL=1|uniref:class I SAM-dependent methyltransferase n=1 Tax=unclassified Microbacterium TaxID=2609290 RepID=UPI000868E665|nr:MULTISPECIES: class I SAM-dependent methyltransferase [unclassified Microbacterium]MBN9211615.1 class I SAM-dependent methyltransferase [Microbacterium sp.]ODT38727.1 MAG: methyltransferase [Microbacterium sp. SCN 71-17]ODU52965.1 MAG: methyltransferase [Microbacterium sp. SCN 70-10]OJV75284.1 MAG: methyltransferase [Microbacterium sp. 71-36]